MSIRESFLYLIGLRPTLGPRTFKISESLHNTLSTLAKHEGRPEHDLLPDLLAAGLTQYRTVDELWPKWESLSPREQDVAALVCLGYTNRQAAARLGTSPETIKTQMRAVLRKFEVETRSQLRMQLADWDFSAWTTNR
jgi:DNA-binding CsgD family transcriptional regulator